MVRVYGYSDDLIELEGSKYNKCGELDMRNTACRIWFDDGTVIRVGYGKYFKQPDGTKKHFSIWYIVVETKGDATQALHQCNKEYNGCYYDVFVIDAQPIKHKFVKHKEPTYEWVADKFIWRMV